MVAILILAHYFRFIHLITTFQDCIFLLVKNQKKNFLNIHEVAIPENHVCAPLKYFVITILHKEHLVVKIFYYPCSSVPMTKEAE